MIAPTLVLEDILKLNNQSMWNCISKFFLWQTGAHTNHQKMRSRTNANFGSPLSITHDVQDIPRNGQ